MDLVRHELGLSKAEKRFPRKDTCLAIYSHRVNTQRPLKETLQTHVPLVRRVGRGPVPACSRTTSRRKLANQALDYDDLLLYWHAMMRGRGARRRDRRPVRPHPGRRVPGHQRAAGRDPASGCSPRARGSRWSATTRRRSTRSAPRRWRTSSGFRPSSRNRRSSRSVDHARGKLPLDPAGARRGKRADAEGARQYRKELHSRRRPAAGRATSPWPTTRRRRTTW